MNNHKRFSENWLAIGSLILVAVVFFFDVLILGRSFFAGDNLSINVPSKVLFFRMLSHGQLPLWNPYVFSGTPFLADINLGLLSPFNLFYIFLTPLRALTFSVVSAVLFAGISMYFYSRKIGLSFYGALTASIILMFSGTYMTHLLNTAILNTIVWLPLLLYLLEGLIQEHKLKYATFAAITVSFSLFGGHIQYFFYIVLLAVSYVFAGAGSFRQKLTYLAYVFIPALFLTAVQWVPFLEYAGFSTRPVRDLSYAGSLQPISFIHLLLPNFFGVAKDGTSWGATADINGYIGIIPLILVFLALPGRKSRLTWFFLITAFVSLLLALGKYSPLYLLAFYIIPFFSRFRSPAGILFLYTFSLSVVAGMTIQNLKKLSYARLILTLSAIALAILFLFHNEIPVIIVRAMERLNSLKKTAFVTRFLEYSPLRMKIIFSLWFENITLLLFSLFSFAIVVLLHMRKIISERMFKFLLIFVIMSDLIYFGSNTNIVTDEGRIRTPQSLESFFRKDTGSYRVLTYPDPGAKPPFADPLFFETEAEKAMDFLQPNTNIFTGIKSISGYASVVRKDYAAAVATKKTSDPTGITLPEPGSPILNELNVKYILTGGTMISTLSALPDYIQVFTYQDPRIDRTFSVFENLAVYPRAYLLNDHGIRTGSASVQSETPNRMVIKTSSTENANLILSEMIYPGWEAKVDGEKRQIQPYKNIFRSVGLAKGNYLVEFNFTPKSLLIAGIISTANWLYVLGFLVIILLPKHEEVREKLHIGKSRVKKNT